MSTAVSTNMFRVGDRVTTKYAGAGGTDAGRQAGVGYVQAVDGDTVTVFHEWLDEAQDHHVSALLLTHTVERGFIPDDEFAREVRQTRTPSRYTTGESVATVQVRGGVSDRDRMGAIVTVWRWEADSADQRPDQRKVATLARNAIRDRRTRLSKLYVEVFRSEHGAGVASRTVYQVVAR